MGDAKDIVFGRERSEDTARIERERREAAKLRDEIATVMPKSIDNLRRHDYTFASHGHTAVTFRGEDRVGWSSHNGLYGDTPCGHDIFILADGSVVNCAGREAQEVDLTLLPLSCIREVWRTTLAMAAHTKRPDRTLQYQPESSTSPSPYDGDFDEDGVWREGPCGPPSLWSRFIKWFLG